jgi:hypothetical protein
VAAAAAEGLQEPDRGTAAELCFVECSDIGRQD